MLKIETKKGSATSPQPKGGVPIIIAHLCNDKGGFGAGFVLAVSKLSKAPEQAYRAWAKEDKLVLGSTQFVEAKPDIIIANMIAQDGYADDHADGVAVNYDALRKCLYTTFCRAQQLGAELHLPAGMGSGLAGGDKDKILGIITEVANEVHTSADGSVNITLWEFGDTTASSYVPGNKKAPPVKQGGAIQSDELSELG